MKVSYTRKAVLRAAIKGHVIKTRELKSTKSKVKSSQHENRRITIEVLDGHRRDFRQEGRTLHLAYNFAKGTPYAKVEREPRVDEVLVSGIANLVRIQPDHVRVWLGLPPKDVLLPRPMGKSARQLMEELKAS